MYGIINYVWQRLYYAYYTQFELKQAQSAFKLKHCTHTIMNKYPCIYISMYLTEKVDTTVYGISLRPKINIFKSNNILSR